MIVRQALGASLALVTVFGCSSSTSSTGSTVDASTGHDASFVPDSSAPSDASAADAGDPFIVKGVSGKDAFLDRKWLRGCIPGSNGVNWTDASRTIIGRQLTFTLVDYVNSSSSPDCKTGRVGSATFSMTVTYENKQVPITWTDPDGKAAAAPSGLEAIKTANAASALMTTATITPDTAARAADLNTAKFCNKTDWAAGVAYSAVECLTGGVNPFKATLIVDDRAMPWKVYDGVGAVFDMNGYPTDMANYLPHQGPYPL